MKRLVYSGLLIVALTVTAAFGVQNKNPGVTVSGQIHNIHPRNGNGNVMHRGNTNRPIRGNTNRPIRGNSNRPVRGNSNTATRHHKPRNKNAAS